MEGVESKGGVPDGWVVGDVEHADIAGQEARRLGSPVVAVVDTNSNPDDVDYVIPGNDDAIRAIQLYVKAAADAIMEGREYAQTQSGGDSEFVEVEAAEGEKAEG